MPDSGVSICSFAIVRCLFLRHCAVSIPAGKRARHKKQIPNEKVLTDGDP